MCGGWVGKQISHLASNPIASALTFGVAPATLAMAASHPNQSSGSGNYNVNPNAIGAGQGALAGSHPLPTLPSTATMPQQPNFSSLYGQFMGGNRPSPQAFAAALMAQQAPQQAKPLSYGGDALTPRMPMQSPAAGTWLRSPAIGPTMPGSSAPMTYMAPNATRFLIR